MSRSILKEPGSGNSYYGSDQDSVYDVPHEMGHGYLKASVTELLERVVLCNRDYEDKAESDAVENPYKRSCAYSCRNGEGRKEANQQCVDESYKDTYYKMNDQPRPEGFII